MLFANRTDASSLIRFHPYPVTRESLPDAAHDVLCERLPQKAPRLNPAAAMRSKSIDRKSTRLNSSHANISYAAFCLEQKRVSARSMHAPASPHGWCVVSRDLGPR